jgi:hypothetical protein
MRSVERQGDVYVVRTDSQKEAVIAAHNATQNGGLLSFKANYKGYELEIDVDSVRES